jgi:ABC-type glycerol-3-phosphate transport system substrate-binding protein
MAMVYPVGNFSTARTAEAAGKKFTWDLFPFPPLEEGDEVKATGGPAIIASVPTNAKQPDAAMEYIRMLTDAEGSAELIKRDYIPAYEIDTSANTNPLYARMVGFQPTAQTRAIFVPKVYDALVNGMQSLLNGNGTPADVISGMVKASA